MRRFVRSAARFVADVLFGVLVEVTVFGLLGALAYLVIVTISQTLAK